MMKRRVPEWTLWDAILEAQQPTLIAVSGGKGFMATLPAGYVA